MSKRTTKLPFVQVSTRLKPVLATGHPWVYANAIERAPPHLSTGMWVRVQCGNLQFYGLWDANSAIAVRLFSSRRRPNREWVTERVRKAWALREPLRDPEAGTTAYRWLYGEGDGLPGIVVDLYGDTVSGEKWAILRTYSESVESIKPWVVAALTEVTSLAGIVQREDKENRLLTGVIPPSQLIICERGDFFEVDVLRGQKTGFFLDQRDNRQVLRLWSRDRRVLNLFSYTGGFSVQAALGGATQVTSVDSAAAAMATAERAFALNELNPSRYEFIVEDCFEILEGYHSEGRRFDLIVVDPPSFARSKAQLPAALNAYHRLNTLALKCLESGGMLATSSCSSQVSQEAFRQMLTEAATNARRRVLIQHEGGQPLDHPVPAHFPEGRYLKFVIAAVESIL